MKVLLIQPPIEDFYLTEVRTYPLGLLYQGTVLREHGVDVQVLDCLKPYKKKTIPLPGQFAYLKKYYNEKETGPTKLFGAYYRFGLSNKQILDCIAETRPDYIGITANFTAYFDTIAELTWQIKDTFPAIKIIIGGYHATVYQKEIEQRYPQIDKVITGPDMVHILNYLGIKPKETCFSRIIPDRSLIDSTQYKMHRQNFSFVVASRGCPRNCSFCTVRSMHGNKVLVRTPEHIMQELENLYNSHEVRVFDFEDDNLSMDRARFHRLLDLITARFTNIRLYAMNGLSAETLDKETLGKMYAAGFRDLNLSLVTSQDEHKHRLGRPFDNRQFGQTAAAAKELGYNITAYLIIGLPGQSKKEVEETLDYLSRQDVLIAPSFFYPPPGTDMFRELVKNGQIDKDNWISFRSSVFPVETMDISRDDMAGFFRKIREMNYQKAK